MTPFRMASLIGTVFALSLPAAFLIQDGPSALLPSFAEPDEGTGEQEKDDPVVDVLCLKAMGAMQKGDFKAAIATYTRAIERDPKYSFAYIGRGDAYLGSGDYDRAIADYDRASRADPSNPIGRERADAARRARALE